MSRAKRSVTKLPSFVAPQLATLVEAVPSGPQWLFELKFDGYRTVTAASGNQVRCYTRSGLDWTHKFGELPQAIAKLGLQGVLLDGEIVAIDNKGLSDFSRLQEALTNGGSGLSYFVFDLLAERGRDLREQPLLERKIRLRELLAPAGAKGPIFYSDHIVDHGDQLFRTACTQGFEGVIAKRGDRPYRPNRGNDWLKVKCGHEQEFVIIGSMPSDKARPFSSIVLAVNEKGKLRYVGRVGSGFGERELDMLSKRFASLARSTRPVEVVPNEIKRKARWVEPRLVAQIAFAGFTGEGYVRQGRFLGLREDKPAKAVKREVPKKLQEAVK